MNEDPRNSSGEKCGSLSRDWSTGFDLRLLEERIGLNLTLSDGVVKSVVGSIGVSARKFGVSLVFADRSSDRVWIWRVLSSRMRYVRESP